MSRSELVGLDAFRDALADAGWLIQRGGLRSEHNACNWYAWRRERIDGPDCECNDKPPGLIVWPHQFSANFLARHASVVDGASVTIEICGERGGQWLKFQIYSLTPGVFFDRFPLAARQLAAAWRAAAEV